MLRLDYLDQSGCSTVRVSEFPVRFLRRSSPVLAGILWFKDDLERPGHPEKIPSLGVDNLTAEEYDAATRLRCDILIT